MRRKWPPVVTSGCSVVWPSPRLATAPPPLVGLQPESRIPDAPFLPHCFAAACMRTSRPRRKPHPGRLLPSVLPPFFAIAPVRPRVCLHAESATSFFAKSPPPFARATQPSHRHRRKHCLLQAWALTRQRLRETAAQVPPVFPLSIQSGLP